MKKLEEIENKDIIKEILDPPKIIKSQRQPKNMKYSPLLHSKKTQHMQLLNTKINDEKYVI